MNREEWIDARVHAAARRLPAPYAGLALEHDGIRDWCSAVVTGTARALVITGPKGTGKTGNAWLAYPYLMSLGWVGRFRALTEVDYLDSCLGDGSTAARAKWAGVLLFDDIGGGTVSDWSRSRVLSLLDTRWSAGLPTIVTTNLTESQLAAHLGDRAASRLADRARLVTLTGPDRRLA